MAWQPTLCESQRLIFVRLGFLRGEVRLYLRSEDDDFAKYVVHPHSENGYHPRWPVASG